MLASSADAGDDIVLNLVDGTGAVAARSGGKVDRADENVPVSGTAVVDADAGAVYSLVNASRQAITVAAAVGTGGGFAAGMTVVRLT